VAQREAVADEYDMARAGWKLLRQFVGVAKPVGVAKRFDVAVEPALGRERRK
jgi:hypothetical protein